MNKEYLPSKQFVSRLIIIVILCIIAICVYKISIYFKTQIGKSPQTKLIVRPGLIQKDSNSNGIPDWEESLWGLDPNKNGDSNKEIILAKRQALARENNLDLTSDQPLSENEALSREFFAIILSLQQSGTLDEQAISLISDTVGSKIVPTPINDIYLSSSIRVEQENKTTVTKYYSRLRDLILKYDNEDIGQELGFISVGLQNNDPGALTQAKRVANEYRSFGKDLMTMSVPASLVTLHVDLANNYEKTAQSIEGLTKILTDQIGSMKALINYKKYNDLLGADLQKLSDIFTEKWYTDVN